jgi:hypothetical protein
MEDRLKISFPKVTFVWYNGIKGIYFDSLSSRK